MVKDQAELAKLGHMTRAGLTQVAEHGIEQDNHTRLVFLSHVLGLSAPQILDDGDFMPLADLELTKKDANRQLLKDFDYWMWNS